MNEEDLLKESGTIISFLYPAQNKELVEKIRSKGVSAFAMDCMPRTLSRAQVRPPNATTISVLVLKQWYRAA